MSLRDNIHKIDILIDAMVTMNDKGDLDPADARHLLDMMKLYSREAIEAST